MKRKLLKGNYEVEKNPEAPEPKEKTLEFEDEVLKKLGGSVAMVRSSKLVED